MNIEPIRDSLYKTNGQNSSLHQNLRTNHEASPIAKIERAINLDHSRPLDVHRWSDYREADDLIDLIFHQITGAKGTKTERKHIKVVILDLHVA